MKVRRTARLIARLQRFVSRPWYLPLIALLAALDLFVGFIPSDGLVISSVMLKPHRWLSTSLWMACGSAVGALALAALVETLGKPVVRAVLPGAMESTAWQSVADFLQSYGTPALALMALGPLPQHPAVAICALAHMPLTLIALSVLAGRLIKYLLFAWSASHAQRLFKRWRGARNETEQIEAAAQAERDSVPP